MTKDLYKFLTSKCKERGIKIEELPRRFHNQYSRSTIYRYMKGIICMTPEVQELFTKLLNLNHMEQAQLTKLISLSAYDESMVAARKELDQFLLPEKEERTPLPDIEFIFYNKDKYIRTVDEIICMLQALTCQDSFSCDIKIIGCIQSNIIEYFLDFMKSVFSVSAQSTAEHLVVFSEKDYLQNIMLLINTFPLLTNEQYKVLYYKSASSGSVKTLFDDTLLLSCRYNKNNVWVEKYYILSFLEHGMPECIVFDDPYMYSFFIKNYMNYKQNFKNALTQSKNISLIDSELLRLEETHDVYMIKQNNCYNKIPASVYRSMLNRLTPDEKMALASFVSQEPVRDESLAHDCIENIFEILDLRVNCSIKNKQIDVYSKAGLTALAKTGRISDHMDALPSFSKEETKAILTYICDRNSDPKDNYTLFLVDELKIPGSITVIKDYGVIIEYDHPSILQGIFKNLTICNQNLINIFTDYVENHIPINHALSKEETTVFISEVIEEYL